MAARDPAPFRDFAASQRPQPPLRQAITAHYRDTEADCVSRLAAAATLPPEDAAQARLTAIALVERLRADGTAGIAQETKSASVKHRSAARMKLSTDQIAIRMVRVIHFLQV